MARSSGPWRGRLANASLLLASTVLVLLALEGVFRRLDIRGWHEPRSRAWGKALVPPAELPPGIEIRFKPYARFRFNYDSNPRGYFDDRNGLLYETNRWGFRGADFTLGKPPGTRRVLVLGDSFTFGEGVRLEDTFCRRLEQQLNAAGQGPVQVLNLGTSGWGTRDEISYLQQGGLGFQPDLVIVAYVLNDASYAGDLDLWEDFRESYEKRWLRSSYVASWAWAAVARRTLARRYVSSLVRAALSDTADWQESFRLLSQGQELTLTHGGRFLVCIFPFMFELDDRYPFAPVHRHIADYCLTHGVDVLDLFPAFKGHSDQDLWVHPSDPHPNEKGHAIAAQAMGDYIRAHHLIQ
jgi:lysophospholipase L1-like esterase